MHVHVRNWDIHEQDSSGGAQNAARVILPIAVGVLRPLRALRGHLSISMIECPNHIRRETLCCWGFIRIGVDVTVSSIIDERGLIRGVYPGQSECTRKDNLL